MADTPAPGTIIPVNARGDLQSALDSANCGDIIELQADATFIGPFTVPAKNCDINHWIWIGTSSLNSLPAEGQRATPCFAGVASLAGRPQYSCPNPANVMALVQMQIEGDGPFLFAPGANFYRFIGLEISRSSGIPTPARLVSAPQSADHIVFDRSWLHGATQDETFEGISLDSMTNVAVVDSYFSDFHCIAITGLCTDANAIEGGVSDTQDGPFKIEDNFLEASGEGIMFGGGAATLTPTDIEILGNHFWKPWQWMPGNQPFVGGPNGRPFIVKNHLELKNAVRVLVDGNLMQNVWGGFTQYGHGILLSPKSQHVRHRRHRHDERRSRDTCPRCQVTDITIRYVYLSHAGGGIVLATSLSGNGRNGGEALSGTRFSIHDVVFDDLSIQYKGAGDAFVIANSWARNPVNTFTINHVTAFPDPANSMMFIGNDVRTAPMYGFVFTNNLLLIGRYPIWNTGGRSSCSVKDVPATTIKRCFTTYTFANNGLIATPPEYPASSWPANNLFPQTVEDVQFTDFNNGDGGNYELLPTSPYKNKGTDGKDLGADIVTLNAELANVE
jgi:hypothetical protein